VRKCSPKSGQKANVLKEAIRRLPVPVLWQRLGLPGHVTGNCCVRSPLRDDDRRPSFSIYAGGTRWKDFGTGQGGDSFDFYQAIKGTDAKGAWRAFVQLSKW
jgi:hypothetical protein